MTAMLSSVRRSRYFDCWDRCSMCKMATRTTSGRRETALRNMSTRLDTFPIRRRGLYELTGSYDRGSLKGGDGGAADIKRKTTKSDGSIPSSSDQLQTASGYPRYKDPSR
ncbi:hypothetical protein ACKVV1_011567 [Pyricularia oryzae]